MSSDDNKFAEGCRRLYQKHVQPAGSRETGSAELERERLLGGFGTSIKSVGTACTEHRDADWDAVEGTCISSGGN